ncbi:hypothetical protein LCGC14_0662910 [marine sediment metagenome]|uniref:Phage-like element PBSX protein XkdF domain-containing protein n=1 Tax=marine sediment metagenome TaxID=412755 RepID=A0A0F9TEH3_9ZZZZ
MDKNNVVIKPLVSRTQPKPPVRTGGQGGGRHQVTVGKGVGVLVSGYVVRRSDGRLVVRDSRVNADAHGVAKALMELLDIGQDETDKIEFSSEAQGSPLFDLVELDKTFYLAPTEEPDTEDTFELGIKVVQKAADKRYTFGVVYQATNTKDDPELDAHEEFALADDLQEAQWEYVRKGNRNIYLQHGEAANVIGEMVDIVSWPFEVVVKFTGEEEERTIPANSIWMGVVWEEDVWPVVKSGDIGGLSMGGWAKRRKK